MFVYCRQTKIYKTTRASNFRIRNVITVRTLETVKWYNRRIEGVKNKRRYFSRAFLYRFDLYLSTRANNPTSSYLLHTHTHTDTYTVSSPFCFYTARSLPWVSLSLSPRDSRCRGPDSPSQSRFVLAGSVAGHKGVSRANKRIHGKHRS